MQTHSVNSKPGISGTRNSFQVWVPACTGKKRKEKPSFLNPKEALFQEISDLPSLGPCDVPDASVRASKVAPSTPHVSVSSTTPLSLKLKVELGFSQLVSSFMCRCSLTSEQSVPERL